MEPRRFYRNPSGRVLGGVCSGLADYFQFDPTIVRLVFILMTIAGGAGILLYLILLIAVPEKPYDFAQYQTQYSAPMENQQTNPVNEPQQNPGDPYRNHQRNNRNRGNLIGGLVLITLGTLFLADEFIPHVSFSDLWPIILVVIGLGLLINSVAGRRSN